jgi:hypothetical protein
MVSLLPCGGLWATKASIAGTVGVVSVCEDTQRSVQRFGTQPNLGLGQVAVLDWPSAIHLFDTLGIDVLSP